MVRPGGAVFGSLVGAGGVTAYNAYHSNDWGVMRTLQWWVEKGNLDTARANNPEFARLEDMIGRLTREMNSKGRDVYFHPASTSSGGRSFYMVTATGAVIGIVYLRFWKGWALTSFLPVTKDTLNSGLSVLRTGLDGVKGKIQEVRDFVDERVEALSRKQDCLADSQEEMLQQLGDVQHDVKGVGSDIKLLEGDMKEMKQMQAIATAGIVTLCDSLEKIVGQGRNGQAPMSMLRQYLNWFRTKNPLQGEEISQQLPGLEQVLDRTIDENSENYSDNISMARPWPPAARAPIRGRANSPNSNTPVPLSGRGRTQSEHLPSLASLTRTDSAFNRGESAFNNRFSQLSRQWSRSVEVANE